MTRWRGQHVALAARDLLRGTIQWRTTKIPRFTPHDDSTREMPGGTVTPRVLLIDSHQSVPVPRVHAGPLRVGQHALELTPVTLDRITRRAHREGAGLAWDAFIQHEPPVAAFRPHARDGIVPTSESRAPEWRGLKLAVLLAGLPFLERETGVTYTTEGETP